MKHDRVQLPCFPFLLVTKFTELDGKIWMESGQGHSKKTLGEKLSSRLCLL